MGSHSPNYWGPGDTVVTVEYNKRFAWIPVGTNSGKTVWLKSFFEKIQVVAMLTDTGGLGGGYHCVQELSDGYYTEQEAFLERI